MAVVNLYITGGPGTDDDVIDYNVNLIDDKDINKATFEVKEELDVFNGDEIKFYDADSVIQFAGYCKEIVGNEDSKTLVVYSYEITMTQRTVNDIFETIALEDFIEELVETYTNLTFSTTLNTGVIIDRYPAKDKVTWDIMKDLLTASPDLTYKIDYTNKIFYLIQKGDTDANVSLIQRQNALFPVAWKQITDKQVTVLNLIGGVETKQNFTQTFDGTGSQTEFTLSNIPTTIKVEVNSGSGFVEQDLEVDGQTTGDYTLKAEDRLVTFKSGSIPSSGTDNVRVTYNYDIIINIRGFEADPSIINQYGRIERSLTRSYLKTEDDALNYGFEYISRFQSPLYSNVAEIISSLDTRDVIPGSRIWVEDPDHFIEGAVVARYFVIKSVTLNNDGMFIEVGDTRSQIIDFIKELKYNISQLEEKDHNSTIIQKSQIIKNKARVTFSVTFDTYQERDIPTTAFYYDVGKQYDDSNIYDSGDDAGGWTNI